jgi:hypothetical protein
MVANPSQGETMSLIPNLFQCLQGDIQTLESVDRIAHHQDDMIVGGCTRRKEAGVDPVRDDGCLPVEAFLKDSLNHGRGPSLPNPTPISNTLLGFAFMMRSMIFGMA